ncbi:MAG: HIT family protein [Candidatus Roizmanbacteria bacterium]
MEDVAQNTIFAKIVRGELPAYVVDENETYMAFLDIFPSTKGQTIVIPKVWHDPYLFNNPDNFIQDFMVYVKKIALKLDKALGSERCRIFFEGYGVPHLHAKLYPSYGFILGQEDFNPRKIIKVSQEEMEEIHKKIDG